jgi:hypothetical protein
MERVAGSKAEALRRDRTRRARTRWRMRDFNRGGRWRAR